MFRLDKVVISGFKSFCDAAELEFREALTAVVGPNGCGKSNISDAIIWVLGETRASHIRGGKMEDVIFQGSERRRALGMGEVELTLSTDNGHPAADNGRITIHRRVYRSGESEFRLNGRRVRMKDISEILMDTGLGIRNYSVMEQGKIDLILSNKPQDRRKLIEEAAGITRYKVKRRAAELKLDETQANLVRIDDTLAELTRSLNSLKRQASKAKRHGELAALLSNAKRSLYAGRIIEAKRAIDEAAAAMEKAQEREGEASATLGRAEAELAERRRYLVDRSALANSLRMEIGRMNAESERVRTFMEESEKNLSELVERAATARRQIDELEVESRQQQELLDEKSRDFDAARAEKNARREESDRRERTRQESADGVRHWEKRISELRETLMRTIGRIAEARNQAHQIDIAVEKCEFYLGKLEDTTRRMSADRDAARAEVDSWNIRTREAEESLGELQHTARAAVARKQELDAQHLEVRDSLARSRDLISQTTYKIDSLRTLLTNLESQDESVRSAILELVPQAQAAAEAIRAAEGAEDALDTLLTEVTQAVVVDNSATAVEAIRLLRERGAGRGAFVALDFRAEEGADRGSGDVASSIIGEGTIADAVRAAVPEALIVESLSEALSQARQRPHATFVTRSGDLVRGSLIIGGAKKGSRGFFAIKRELADYETLVASERDRASRIDQQLQQIERDLHEADDRRILAEERARQSEKNLLEIRTGRDHALAELERFEKDYEVTSEEHSLYLEEKGQLLRRKQDALDELQDLEKDHKAVEREIHEAEDSLRGSRSEFEEATEVASLARVELEAASGRLTAVQREHENLSRIVHSLRSRVEQLEREIDSLDRRRTETEQAVEESRARLDDLLGRLAESNDRRVALEAEVSDLEQEVTSRDEAATAARGAWNAERDALFEAERQVDRAANAINVLKEQIHLDLHVGIESLAEVEPPADDEARSELEAEVERLTDKLEKLGPVNVLAIEEYNEIEQRENFLRTQRDDLVQSIESLRSTIRKINTTSRELFREAFAAVNENFREIFASLFGGGVAEMKLLDEDDILESGIELVAQPPGKKTQSIALLSGGERALTALALLFSIFRYKPSPFCILDEVDAPLDEVNNERFVRLLREMTGETQFIVITHSKRTMESADVLYGVTMEEAGCSKLVSVALSDE
jgi:chromosome segregation protein